MSKFMAAHIVPVSQLQDTESNKYHMCLAHLVFQSDSYVEHFKNMVNRDKFVIMDNGEAEGEQLGFDELLQAYEIIKPTEIVLPDTLFDSGDTIQKGREFLTYLELNNKLNNFQIMAVPQGNTLEEWKACASVFLQDSRIHTIGISKFLNIVTKDSFIRFKACEILCQLIEKYKRYDVEVHLLGCDEGPVIINMIHKAFSFVRGCDSAFVYLAVQAEKPITYSDDQRAKGSIDFLQGKCYVAYSVYQMNFDFLAGVYM